MTVPDGGTEKVLETLLARDGTMSQPQQTNSTHESVIASPCLTVCGACVSASSTQAKETHGLARDHFIHLFAILCILQVPEMMPHEPVPTDISVSITAGGATATENMSVIVPAR